MTDRHDNEEQKSMRVEIGKMCHKGTGHISLIGTNDHGACGSHYYATVYVELPAEFIAEDGDTFEDNATEAGRFIASQLNRLEDLEMAAWREQEARK